MSSASPLAPGRFGAWPARLFPYLILSLASLFWAGNWVVGRAVHDTVPPVALTFWRWSVAAVLLAPVALPRLKGQGAVLRRHWRVLFLLGLSGVALFQLLIYWGLHHTTAINGMLMNSAAPLFIMLVARVIDGDRIGLRQLAGVAVSFAGILVIMNRGELSNLRHVAFNVGDLVILLGMPTWGVYSVLLRRRPRELDAIALVFVIAVIGSTLLAPLYALETRFVGAPRFTWATAGAVLYIAGFASVGAYICWNRGVAMVGPSNAGFTIHLLPAFGTVLAVLLLGEQFHVFHLVGIATILAGVWLATSARRTR